MSVAEAVGMKSTFQTDEWKRAYRAQAETAGRRGREYGVWLIEQCASDTLCPTDVEQIVADALGDIWIGRVSWDHEAVGLTRAVQDVVRYRVRDLLERVVAHVPLGADGEPDLDALGDEGASVALTARDDARITERLSTEDPRDAIERRDLARRALVELRSRIKEPKVRKLLDVLTASAEGPGLPNRAQLASRVRVTLVELRNLERRLATYAAGLPASLRLDGIANARRPRKRRRSNESRPLGLAQLLGIETDSASYFSTP